MKISNKPYSQQGKLEKSEACYRAAIERDPQDIDIRTHLCKCLLRRGKPGEARPLLDGVVDGNPSHEYGYTLMALAETLTALGDTDAGVKVWQQVTESHTPIPAPRFSWPNSTWHDSNPTSPAERKDVPPDDVHAPAYQRKRDRFWVRRAKALMRKVG